MSSVNAKECSLRSSSMANGGCTESSNDAPTAKTVPFAVVSCSSQVLQHQLYFHPLQCCYGNRGLPLVALPEVSKLSIVAEKLCYDAMQDEDFPASELNKGVLGRGWQSSR